jgi:hypothetical protein
MKEYFTRRLLNIAEKLCLIASWKEFKKKEMLIVYPEELFKKEMGSRFLQRGQQNKVKRIKK